MRTLALMIVTLAVVINMPLTTSSQCNVAKDTAQPSQRLEVQLFTEKHVYKRGDKLDLKVVVSNYK